MGRRVLRRPISGFAVCLCPIKRTPGLNKKKCLNARHNWTPVPFYTFSLLITISFIFQTIICCPVCRYPYDTSKPRTPRILHCGHTTCHACLQKLFKESVIGCPFCRDLTPVMGNNIENLQKNFALVDAQFSDEVWRHFLS